MKDEMILTPVKKRQRTERILGILAVVTLVAAWIIGVLGSKSDIMPALDKVFPETDHLNHLNVQNNDIYAAWGDVDENEFLGYVALGEGNGYGGPLLMAVGVSADGEILNTVLVHHKETPSWMTRVLDSQFTEKLAGKVYSEKFEIGSDVDGVTGATYTSRAIVDANLDAARSVATYEGLYVEAETNPKILFGVPEIVLLGLFAVGYIGKRPNFKFTKAFRWGSMIAGMVILGFIYNRPLTLTYINKFLLGFWPQWQTNLYWYFLIGGIIFVFSVDNKNPYCEWFCPFGAVQECMGLIGGAKTRSAGIYRSVLKWLQRGLAWSAILLALLVRNPGISSFEIFGTLFELIGSVYQFALLGIVLIASMFIRRPWCTYLCPLHPVEDFIRMTRKWILGLWKRKNQVI